jgi:serine protease Do
MKDHPSKTSRWICAGLGTLALAGVVAGAASVHADRVSSQPLADLPPDAAQAIESANDLSTAFRTVANQLLPSVVAIENRPALVSNASTNMVPSGSNNPFRGTPLEDQFRGYHFQQPGNTPQGGAPVPRSGIGSGVIIDSSGIVLTNNHVVAGDGEITIRTQDGRKFVASDVWTDPKSDIAVVKIADASGLTAATLGDSDQTEIGDWVLALGQPFGLESTVTAGIISAKHRGIGITDRENFLQTDAAINPGNSGGPLVNLRGEVVGINTAIHSRSGGSNGIGFAIPSNLARWVSDQLASTGTVKRAYLGVGIQPVTGDLAGALSIPPRTGVVVTDVYPDTPAAAAGMQSGDVIVSFNGGAIATPQALQLAVERSPIGKTLKIEIAREGKRMELVYTGTESPADFGPTAKNDHRSPKKMERLGIEIAPLDSEIADRLGVDAKQGVVITSVLDGGPAAAAGLAPGMVIVEVNRKQVSSPSDFADAVREGLEKSNDGILLLVRTEGGSRFVVIKS